MQWLGRLLMVLGLIVVIVGFVFYMGWGRAAFGWIGHLRGDLRIERDGFRFYFPITTAIILSIALSVVLRLIMMFR